MRRIISSDTLATMLDDPMLRIHLAYSWPASRCHCGASAQAVFCIKWTCENDEVDDWYEYYLGCHSCFTSGFGTKVKAQRALPLVRMFVRVRRADGDHTFPITTPAKHRKVSIGMVLPLTCRSQASKGMQEMLHGS